MLTRAGILASALLLAARPGADGIKSEKNGIGVTINEDFIKEHPMQGEYFNLFKEDRHRRQAKK